jgi:hypothetical protein
MTAPQKHVIPVLDTDDEPVDMIKLRQMLGVDERTLWMLGQEAEYAFRTGDVWED